MDLQGALTVFGGMGLFLYGMFTMGDGLQEAAGDRMRKILAILTSNPLLAVGVGAIVTAIIQASGATTVMVVSFVNAGLMTLEQAIGVIMGANIGTTITAQLVAFNLEQCALPAIGIGMVVKLLAKKKTTKGLASFLLGFGTLFLGISIMGDALGVLKDYPPFVDLILASAKNPVLGVLVGTVFTVLIQSSSATTGLLVTLASKGLMPLDAALPMIFGANIGTTSTALFASVGTTLAARRTAMAHFLFNVGGTLMWTPLLRVFQSIAAASSADPARQIANAHTLFNVSMTLLALPLIKQFTALIKRLVKGDEKVVEHGAKYLDPRLASTPFSAVIQLRKEVLRMAKLCQENLTSAINQFMGRTRQRDPQFNQIETVLDEIEEAIQEYVSKVSQYRVTAEESRIMTAMINIAADLERIGDHATAIAEAAEYKADNSLPFSEEAMEELSHMTGKVLELMDMTLEALGPEGKAKAVAILPADDTFDSMERDLRATHIRRLNEGVCFPASGVLYLDLLTHLERIGDHGVNIAKAIIDMPE